MVRLGVILRLVFRFRMIRRFLAYRPGEVARVTKLLEHVAAVCPGHGPAHLLVESAAEIGFLWSPEMGGLVREGLPVLSNLAVQFSNLGPLFWRVGGVRFLLTFVLERVFVEVLGWM